MTTEERREKYKKITNGIHALSHDGVSKEAQPSPLLGGGCASFVIELIELVNNSDEDGESSEQIDESGGGDDFDIHIYTRTDMHLVAEHVSDAAFCVVYKEFALIANPDTKTVLLMMLLAAAILGINLPAEIIRLILGT